MIGDYGLLVRCVDFSERLSVQVSGAGARTFVLANGFGTTSAIWDGLLPFFEQRGRVVRFDWPVDPHHYDVIRYSSLDGYAEDLLALLVHTQAQPAILVGHSVSGMVGMLAGKHAPEMFERMIMIAPSPCYRRAPGYDGYLDEADVRELLFAMAGNYIQWVKAFAPMVVGPRSNSVCLDHFTRSLLAMRPDVALAMAMTIWKIDLRDQLDGFALPTAILQPEDDPAVPVSVAHFLSAHWREAEVHIIPTSGHLPHLTHPAIIREVLSEVFDSGESRDALGSR
jgi:sigma-B regulation protein RsbQ